MFGDHGLCGLLEEGAHGKSPKCLGGNLGDFENFAKVSEYQKSEVRKYGKAFICLPLSRIVAMPFQNL